MTFDAREPGTPARAWLGSERLAALPALGLPGSGVVVLAAHPDDEVLGAGNLLAELDLRGRPALVVVVTDGAAGTSDGAPSPGLAARRDAELREALALLAPGSEIVTLDVADGGLREARDDVVVRIDALLTARGGVATIVAPWRGDGHRDHRVLGEIAADAARRHGAALWEYPLWLWHWADPSSPGVPWERLRRLRGSGEAAARRARAVDAHASQVAGPDAVVPHDLRRITGRGDDTFVVTAADPGDEDDAAADADAATRGDVPGAFFDATYERSDDPWGFTRRWYEQRKRALTLAALPRERFARVWEVGCSIGVLTAELAPRCEALVAVDVAPAAVERARARLERDGALPPGVELAVMDVTMQAPRGPFDLVVLSEVLYYLTPPTLRAFLARLVPLLAEDAVVIGCHWRHPVTGYALGGDDAQAELAAGLRGALTRTARYVDEDLLLEVFTRDGRSVAARTGLL